MNQTNGIMNLLSYDTFIAQYPQYQGVLTTLGGADWYSTFISGCLSYIVFNNIPVSQLGTHLTKFFDQMVGNVGTGSVRAAS